MTTQDDDTPDIPDDASQGDAPEEGATADAPKRRVVLKRAARPAPKKKVRLVRHRSDEGEQEGDGADDDDGELDEAASIARERAKRQAEARARLEARRRERQPKAGGGEEDEEVLFDDTFEDVIDPEHPEEGVRQIVGAVVERVMPKLLRRIIAAGGEKLTEPDLQRIIRDTPMPRDLSGLLVHQLDNVREEVLRILTQEIQRFLEGLNLSQELQKVLTSVSFEIRTEIRFIPNEKAVVKPKIKNRVRVKSAGGDEDPS